MDKELFEKMGKDLTDKTNSLLEAASENHQKEVKALGDTLRTELGADSEAWKSLQTQLDEIQTTQKKAIEVPNEKMSVPDQIEKALQTDSFKAAQKSKFKTPAEFIIKADDITNSNSITNTIPQPFLVPGISASPYRRAFLRNITNTFNITSPTIYWYEETSRTDGAAMRAEAGAYGQGDQAWTQYNVTAKSVAEYQKFSDEMAEDNDFLMSQMNNKLLTDLSLKIDAQQLSGAGTGNEIKGIDEYVTTYAAPTGLALNIDSPNYFDILLAGLTQVNNAYWNASYFLLHPTNVAQLMSLKTSDAAYSSPPWVSSVGGGLSIMGVPVIANTGVTVNKFYVGDFSKVNFAVRKDIVIRVWDQHSTDPIYGMKTITATARVAQYVSSQETTALVKGDLNQTNLDALSNA